MRQGLNSRKLLIAAAIGYGLSFSGQAQAAGLFDFLFGPSEPAPRYYAPAPIDVRVNPRKKEKKPQTVSVSPDRKMPRATPIDPVKNPEWYLEDPTLRPGDIVVLKGQIIVYNGARGPRMMEDFTSLDKSRYVSKSEREFLRKSADIKPGSPEPKTPQAKQASISSGE